MTYHLLLSASRSRVGLLSIVVAAPVTLVAIVLFFTVSFLDAQGVVFCSWLDSTLWPGVRGLAFLAAVVTNIALLPGFLYLLASSRRRGELWTLGTSFVAMYSVLAGILLGIFLSSA